MNLLNWISLESMLLAQAAGSASETGVMPHILVNLFAVIIYSIVGMLVLGTSFLIMNRLIPFSVRKEIEQDQNISLAIVIGSVIIGISMIISAAIH